MITIPERSYELRAISNYLRAAIFRKSRTIDTNMAWTMTITYMTMMKMTTTKRASIRWCFGANEHTIRNVIKCACAINFSKSNNIGSLLTKSRVLQPNKVYVTNSWTREYYKYHSYRIQRYHWHVQQWQIRTHDTRIRAECPTIYIPPGYKLSETPTQII